MPLLLDIWEKIKVRIATIKFKKIVRSKKGVNPAEVASGLIPHVSNSSRDKRLGPEFESRLGLRYQSLGVRNKSPKSEPALELHSRAAPILAHSVQLVLR